MSFGAKRLPVLTQEGFVMLDLIFLALGLGGFALMGAYAIFCDRL